MARLGDGRVPTVSLPDGVQLAANRRVPQPVRTAAASRSADDGAAVRGQNPDAPRSRRPREERPRVAAAAAGSFADSRPPAAGPAARPAPLASFVPYRQTVAGHD